MPRKSMSFSKQLIKKPSETSSVSLWKSAGKMAIATAVYAGVHSALASRQVKQLATRIFGERRRNGLYRVAFNLQAIGTFAALGLYARKLPNRTLYDIHGPARAWLRLIQLSALGFAVHATRQVGTLRMLGITSARSYRQQDAEVAPEPESQGPTLGEDGHMRVTGAFRISRHPLNLAPAILFAANPTMTVRLASFTAVSLAYFVLGSVHEEFRLRKAYGEPYISYTQSGVPFYLPTGSTAPEHRVRVSHLHGEDQTEAA